MLELFDSRNVKLIWRCVILNLTFFHLHFMQGKKHLRTTPADRVVIAEIARMRASPPITCYMFNRCLPLRSFCVFLFRDHFYSTATFFEICAIVSALNFVAKSYDRGL